MRVDVNKVARESYSFWSPLVADQAHAFALLGNEEGECSFDATAVGDRGEAHGIFQWHSGRAADILNGYGVDVRVASHMDQLKAAYWEMTHGVYRKVWPALSATTTVRDAVTVLVTKYEGSRSQVSDVNKRTAYALKWEAKFSQEAGK